MVGYEEFKGWGERVRGEVFQFSQLLCRTISLSGQEGKMAGVLTFKMEELGYDEVWIDRIGNVIGLIRGGQQGPTIMFNSHLDHVDPGEEANWTHDPYGGEIEEGYLYGRGASDVKGGMGPQIYAGAFLKERREAWGGCFLFTGVVLEEQAESLGMRVLCRDTLTEKGIKCDGVIINEATGLNLSLGHKGRVEFELETLGKTSHGSAPWRGINAIYKMIPVISRIRELGEFQEDPIFGKPTLTPTIISCSPGRLSIIPDRCTVSLDHRYLPKDGIDSIVEKIEKILEDEKARDPEFRGHVRVRKVEEVSYTGYREKVKKIMPSFFLSKNHPLLLKAEVALRGLGESPSHILWDFNTDGGCTATEFNIPTLGYSPGEEVYAHVPDERISLDFIYRSILGNAAIAYELMKE
jgi:putative selenium metabolism hydrolase